MCARACLTSQQWKMIFVNCLQLRCVYMCVCMCVCHWSACFTWLDLLRFRLKLDRSTLWEIKGLLRLADVNLIVLFFYFLLLWVFGPWTRDSLAKWRSWKGLWEKPRKAAEGGRVGSFRWDGETDSKSTLKEQTDKAFLWMSYLITFTSALFLCR